MKRNNASSVRSFIAEVELIQVSMAAYGKNPYDDGLFFSTIQRKTPTDIWDKWSLECRFFKKEEYDARGFVQFLRTLVKSYESHAGCSDASSNSSGYSTASSSSNSNSGRFNKKATGRSPQRKLTLVKKLKLPTTPVSTVKASIGLRDARNLES